VLPGVWVKQRYLIGGLWKGDSVQIFSGVAASGNVSESDAIKVTTANHHSSVGFPFVLKTLAPTLGGDV
jgi:hypothetical protein